MKFDDLVDHMKACGLDDKEATIYLDLIVHGPAKASEVGKRTQLSRMDAYNHLKELESRGLVEATMERPMRFIPLDLEEGIELLVKQKEREIERIEDHGEVLQDNVEPREPDPGRYDVTFKVHQDRQQILLQMSEFLEEAEETVQIVFTRNGLVNLLTRMRDDLFEAALDRGVEVRIITELDEDNLEHAGPIVDWTEVRHSAYANHDMIVRDGSEILVYMAMQERWKSKGGEDTALWTNSTAFIESQEAFFDRLWLDSTAFEDRVTEIRTGRIIEPLRLNVGGGSMYDRFEAILEDDPALLHGDPSATVDAFDVETAQLVHAIGRRIGEEAASDLDSDDVDAFWEALPERWSDLGLGDLSLEVVGPDEVEATVAGSLVARRDLDADAPVCSLEAGILAGAARRLVGTRCHVEEQACAATGEAACVFAVRFERDEPLLPVLKKRG